METVTENESCGFGFEQPKAVISPIVAKIAIIVEISLVFMGFVFELYR